MKKLLLLSIILLGCLNLNSQEIRKVEVDKFSKKEKIETSTEKLFVGLMPFSLATGSKFEFYISRYGETYRIFANIMLPEMVKYSDGDGIDLLLANGDVVSLLSEYKGLSSKKVGDNRGYVFETVFILSDEDVNLLKQNHVTDIRIRHFDSYTDKEIKEDKRGLIKTMLNLFNEY